MKIAAHNNKLETNVENETQNFGIGDASVVIEILRNRLYEHKVRTLVQEYICNARDAMREVGKGNDFEITVPTPLNPVFKVRDFGPGISPSRMKDVFVMYGSSTKRATNNQTGGFGIGAKSAWSYTDSFTIVSIVDGVRRTYVAHTGVNNNGRLDLVSTDKTTESNGTEIQVAVKPHNVNEFRSAVFRAIYFWEQKPILKGELDVPTLVKGEVLSDLVEIVDNNALPEYVRMGHSYDTEALAVIDGIPYMITSKLVSKIKSLSDIGQILKKDLILHFGNGVVEVSASREAIADSTTTTDNLEKLGRKALVTIKNHIATQFAQATDTASYIKTYAKMNPLFVTDKFAKFGPYSVRDRWIEGGPLHKTKVTIVHSMDKNMRRRIEKITKDVEMVGRQGIEIEYFNDIFFVSKKESNVVQNKRIREYLKSKNKMILVEVLETSVQALDANGKPLVDKDGKIVLKDVSYPAEWAQVVQDFGAKDFSSIAYVDPPKVTKPKVVREDTEICLHTFYGTRHTYTTLAKNDDKWLYVNLQGASWPSEFGSGWLKELDEYLREYVGYQICGVSERAAKMIEGDENFSPLQDWLDEFKPTKEILNHAVLEVLANHIDTLEVISQIKDIDDSFLVDAAKVYKTATKSKLAYAPELLKKKISASKEVKEVKEMSEKLTRTLKNNYPLLNSFGRYSKHVDELAFYINAKYKLNKEK